MSQSDDLIISRRAAIDALHTWFRDGFDEDRWWNSTHVLAAIEGLPSAQQEPKWIPCSERLPKKMGYYLTSNEYKVVHEDYYWGNGCFEKAKKYQCEVVAWMPMPIPPYCGGNGE